MFIPDKVDKLSILRYVSVIFLGGTYIGAFEGIYHLASALVNVVRMLIYFPTNGYVY